MNREEDLRKLAEKAKGLGVECEPGEYECGNYCSESGCHGHENGWATLIGDGPDCEIQIEMGHFLEACDPDLVAALCDVAAKARETLPCFCLRGEYDNDPCAEHAALAKSLDHFDTLLTSAQRARLEMMQRIKDREDAQKGS